jgi:hypothetical protein
VKKYYHLFLLLTLASCAGLRDAPKYQLSDAVYHFRQKGEKYQKAWVYVNEDSIRVLSYEEPHDVVSVKPHEDKFFLKRSFDVDVTTIGFKYRPATLNLPRQLTTDFNGNIFLGYRFDRFRVKYKPTPFGHRSSLGHRGVTMGVFGGLGSTSITPWTTNNAITEEYNGLILSRGFALMLGVNDLTVGLGVGWDYLTDRDKNVWIYQNRSWYGLSIGLNLN